MPEDVRVARRRAAQVRPRVLLSSRPGNAHHQAQRPDEQEAAVPPAPRRPGERRGVPAPRRRRHARRLRRLDPRIRRLLRARGLERRSDAREPRAPALIRPRRRLPRGPCWRVPALGPFPATYAAGGCATVAFGAGSYRPRRRRVAPGPVAARDQIPRLPPDGRDEAGQARVRGARHGRRQFLRGHRQSAARRGRRHRGLELNVRASSLGRWGLNHASSAELGSPSAPGGCDAPLRFRERARGGCVAEMRLRSLRAARWRGRGRWAAAVRGPMRRLGSAAPRGLRGSARSARGDI
mmetsp:Transcript_29167/g.100664  ORF Transcript_29167/g.100664 Transcript_29167/m.100664 type:complete len:295 (-) Transcript_29167:489-1373(-)